MTEPLARDIKAMDDLRASVGFDTAEMLFQSFSKEARESVSKIDIAIQDKDWRTLDVTSHALKTVSLTFGATLLSEAALALEMAAKDILETGGETEAIEKCHKKLKHAMKRTTTAFGW